MRDRAERMFETQHPDTFNNVFLMMHFDSSAQLARIRKSVDAAASAAGFTVVRADDIDYTGELWTNVTLCMEHCAVGIAVFDGMSAGPRECDFNICLELGYMLALNKPCLLLRDKRLGPPAPMIANRLHVPFDSYEIESTLEPAISGWLSDQRCLSAPDMPR